MEKINFTLSIQVTGGPAIAIAGLLEVDAYEKMEVTVPAKAAAAGTAKVTVSPAQLADTKMLVIQATSKDGSLKFKTSEGGAVDRPITGPVTLLSGTACDLLGTQPDNLTFTNEAGAPATVTIFVARKAVV